MMAEQLRPFCNDFRPRQSKFDFTEEYSSRESIYCRDIMNLDFCFSKLIRAYVFLVNL